MVVRHFGLGPCARVALARRLDAHRRLTSAARDRTAEDRRVPPRKRRGVLAVSVVRDGTREQVAESRLELRKRDPVLWTLRSRNARAHRREIELQGLRVVALAGARDAEEALFREVAAERVDMLAPPARGEQVPAGFLVDREEPHRGA